MAALMTSFDWLGWTLLAMSGAGCLYLALATLALARHMRGARPAALSDAAVTILKPLYGAEPRLYDNLASFLRQDHDGPMQLLCGVHGPDDPAVAVVERLRRDHPAARIDLVIDTARHGANAKVGNLINMTAAIAHPVVVLSDSDIAVAPDYLARVLAALAQPGTGAVTCLYAGRGDAGFWSRMGAAQINYSYLPNLVFSATAGLVRPCMGSTIALTRDTLDRIGGFAAFADILADDYAIGDAVARLGLTVALPPMLVTHGCTDASARALARHELRWGATVRAVAPAGYAGSVVTYPLPLACLGAIIHPLAGAGLIVASLLLRAVMKRTIDRITGARPLPVWLLPLRDGTGFLIFLASLFIRRVDWRGARLTMTEKGRITADMESAP